MKSIDAEAKMKNSYVGIGMMRKLSLHPRANSGISPGSLPGYVGSVLGYAGSLTGYVSDRTLQTLSFLVLMDERHLVIKYRIKPRIHPPIGVHAIPPINPTNPS